jgi:hypothetical protein
VKVLDLPLESSYILPVQGGSSHAREASLTLLSVRADDSRLGNGSAGPTLLRMESGAFGAAQKLLLLK